MLSTLCFPVEYQNALRKAWYMRFHYGSPGMSVHTKTVIEAQRLAKILGNLTQVTNNMGRMNFWARRFIRSTKCEA